MILTAAERQAFSDNGWLVIRKAVSPERTAALEDALDAVYPEAAYASGHAGRVIEIASISRGSQRILENAYDRQIAELAAAALDVPSLRFFQDTAFIKPKGGGGRVEWHQDYTYFAFLDRPNVLTARLALTTCTRQNGCLRVVSGSHKWGLAGEALSFGADSVEDALSRLSPERRNWVLQNQTELELEPGDLSLHHCLTFHGSLENDSDRPRKTLAIRLVDGDVRLVPARLPSPDVAAYFPTDSEGHLADSAFPLLFCRPT